MPEVRVDRDGPVTTVILARPDVRNAIDLRMAGLLAEAFRAFDAGGPALSICWSLGGGIVKSCVED